MSARFLLVCALVLAATPTAAQERITIISDAFGSVPRLQHDWGFSALVEAGGKRILFDLGNDARKFEHNVHELGVDLAQLDFVVISHRHGDHTAGLRHLRLLNPDVNIYVPPDEHFGGPTPAAFFRPEPSLPAHMRYFSGAPPDVVPHGTAWGDIRFIAVDKKIEIAPGIRLIPAVSDAPGTNDLTELALAIDTPSGHVIVAGCSHPGVANVLREAVRGPAPVRLLVGGFHWVTTPVPEIRRMATALRTEHNVLAVAPGHCTGEPAFKELRSVFGEKYVYAGTGTTIEVTHTPQMP
jgi:7,8-dihydropterin-6-yl-methyl-4-(beta-D-ribofuranosyl)aminobenzene 5'-phosphate synthase